jgi:hypothetical protein
MKKLIPIAVLIVAIIGSVIYWFAHRGLPKFELGSEDSNYRTELAESFDPRAKIIEQQIAEGPAALAKAKLAVLEAGIDLDAPSQPNIPPNEDAAPLYIQWYSMVRSKSESAPMYMEPLGFRFRYTPNMLAAVHKIDDDKSIAILYEAIRKPCCTPPVDMGYGNLLRSTTLRDAAREVYTQSTLLALAGRTSDAASTEAKCFKIQEDCEGTLGIVPFLAEMSIDTIALDGFEKILCHAQPNAALSRQVTDYVLKNPETHIFKRSLQGQAATYFSQMAPEYGSNQNDATLPDEDKLFQDNLIYAASARYLYLLAKAAKVSDEAPAFRRRDLAKISQMYISEPSAWAERLRQTNVTNDTNFGEDPIAAFSFPAEMFDIDEDHIDTLTARRNELLAGAAVLTVKAETGSYPRRLPGNFTDPYSGKSLVYKLSTNGFVIYSVGRTGTFAGGTINQKNWDTEFAYPAPPPKPVPAKLLKSE